MLNTQAYFVRLIPAGRNMLQPFSTVFTVFVGLTVFQLRDRARNHRDLLHSTAG